MGKIIYFFVLSFCKPGNVAGAGAGAEIGAG